MYIDVYFYRKGKGYYFEFDGTNYECNDVTLAELKSNLSLPYNLSFSGYSRSQMMKVVGTLIHNCFVSIKDVSKKENEILKFEVAFRENDYSLKRKMQIFLFLCYNNEPRGEVYEYRVQRQ